MNRKIFEKILEKRKFPHMLFYGPPGAGKTTSADNLIRKYQSLYSRVNKENIIHLNASDERGIEVIRTQIQQFVKSNNMFETGYKFVVLDEVDYMTKNAQQALKNLLQSCLNNVRFCLICNYICKIDDSLKNEFICIRFNQLNKSFEKFLIVDTMWENLHHLFLSSSDSCLVKVREWINHTSIRCNLDIKTIVKHYFHYMIQHHSEFIVPSFLNIIENIVHNYDTNIEYILYYFIEHVKKEYENKGK